jgi:hypothetical protein
MKLAFSAKLNRLNDLPIASPLLQNAFFLVLLLLPVFSVRPVAARLLEGKIEHAEALPPVEEDFSVGKTFDPNLYAQKPQRAYHFYRIPAWLAGKWQITETIQTAKLDIKRGKIDRHRKASAFQTTDTFGDTIDGNGRIWQFDRTPFSYRTDHGDTILFTRTKSSEPTETAPYQVTLNTLMENVKVDKATGKIVAAWESENLQTYTPKGESEIRVETSQKDFNARGEATQLIEGYALEERLEEFRSSPDPNLKAALEQFLESIHEKH